jgi:hypothetical protein
MTRDDIIRMARDSEMFYQPQAGYIAGLDRLERFAALVAAAEREACAQVCEAQENRVVRQHPARIEFDPDSLMARKCAAVIRTRGEK